MSLHPYLYDLVYYEKAYEDKGYDECLQTFPLLIFYHVVNLSYYI